MLNNKTKTIILDNARKQGKTDFLFMYTPDEKSDRGWIISDANIDETEPSELGYILENTRVTKEEVYETDFIYDIKEAYIDGWNKEARERGLE